MGEPKNATIYLTNIEDNNIIKLPISGLNDGSVCMLNETANESTWGKETVVDQETCKLIQLLEEPVNVHANVKHVKQSIDPTIVGEKKIFSNRRCNNKGMMLRYLISTYISTSIKKSNTTTNNSYFS